MARQVAIHRTRLQVCYLKILFRHVNTVATKQTSEWETAKLMHATGVSHMLSFSFVFTTLQWRFIKVLALTHYFYFTKSIDRQRTKKNGSNSSHFNWLKIFPRLSCCSCDQYAPRTKTKSTLSLNNRTFEYSNSFKRFPYLSPINRMPFEVSHRKLTN